MCYHLRDMEKFNLNGFFFFFLFWEKKVGIVNGFLTSHLNLLKYFNFGTIDVIHSVPINLCWEITTRHYGITMQNPPTMFELTRLAESVV